ncbi:hypothetical protein RIF29_39019 [Crotalaria pallida]|uniref:CCT domain-containing protein n=1 Tax=Crotalaria pallida TaxID=3830 RepID=A0AAN9HPF6_CROPI
MSSSQNWSKNDRKRSSNWESSSTFDSSTSYNRDFEGMPPYCACGGGVRVVLRTACTQEHYGLRFWGCRFYKKDVKDSGCNFFDWYKDDVVREKEVMIMKQKMEMESIHRDLDSIKKDLELLQKDLESFQKDLEFSRRLIKILVVLCVDELPLFLLLAGAAECDASVLLTIADWVDLVALAGVDWAGLFLAGAWDLGLVGAWNLGLAGAEDLAGDLGLAVAGVLAIAGVLAGAVVAGAGVAAILLADDRVAGAGVEVAGAGVVVVEIWDCGWFALVSFGYTGTLQKFSVPQRLASLIRFREKRKERNFDKKIRYTVRKEVALRMQRNRGQFTSAKSNHDESASGAANWGANEGWTLDNNGSQQQDVA